MNNDLTAELAAAQLAARRAGSYLKEQYNRPSSVEVSYKGDINIVTSCDLESERLIIDALAAACPGIAFFSEEAGASAPAGNGARWIIDPIDGTSNFAHGLPHFCVSIALEQGGAVQLGVVYDPMMDEMFSAVRGGGATRNGTPIQVSATEELKDAVVSSGFPYDAWTSPHNNLREWGSVTRHIRSPRSLGAAALDISWVACGRLDAHWELDLEPWDIAAAGLFVREAGGAVTGLDGDDFNLYGRAVLASNGRMHEALLAVINTRSEAPATP